MKKKGVKTLPSLDIYRYNWLLHYVLSPKFDCPCRKYLASYNTWTPATYNPDTITLKIIARSGTLLRDSEIANLVLLKLKGSWNSLMPTPGASESSLKPSSLHSLLNIRAEIWQVYISCTYHTSHVHQTTSRCQFFSYFFFSSQNTDDIVQTNWMTLLLRSASVYAPVLWYSSRSWMCCRRQAARVLLRRFGKS